ncbi:Armadillo-type fold, partial [Cynara cardunculus var. scolymus]
CIVSIICVDVSSLKGYVFNCFKFDIIVLKFCRKMGVISRKIFPACVNMCVCCPSLRSRSRQPVKRYKKLLAEIFPKSPGGSPNERKIAKLCEYAAKNPFRIPKIAKYLEERCYKELRLDHVELVNVITEVYSKLICMCKEQMAYFAVNLLNVSIELLDDSKRDTVQIIGCQTLTRFIYSQVDGTYTYNLENIVQKVCMLARKPEEEDEKTRLRAASLQCLSAMIWFMTEFSHIFVDFDEIVHVTLGNYEPNTNNEQDDDRGEAHHNWVDEVVRCEARGPGIETDSSYMLVKPRAEKKDPSLLTREEAETPKVWAQICVQRMVELAKEKNQQLILASVVHHLDHKNVSHDPELKSYVIQTTTALAWQVRSEVALKDIGFVSDLCRHLRKSLQATVFPEGLLLQLLKLMLHPDVEIRLSGHQIYSVLLIPSSNHLRRDASNHTRRWSSDTASVFASVTSLLDKLRREKDGTEAEKREEQSVMKFSEDQITQLLSAFWIQANLLDNRMLYPAHQRSLLTLSTAMLMFAAKMYQIPDIADVFQPMLKSDVSDDFQVYVKPQADVNEYCSDHDNQAAASLLVELQSKMFKSYEIIVDILVRKLSKVTEMEAEELRIQLLETFMPDDATFGPESMLHLDQYHRDFPTNSLVEDDATSESSVSDLSRFISKSPTPSSMSHALEAAGQVAGASVSTSPLPFSAMAGQCEALGTDSRKKLSSWLSSANVDTKAAAAAATSADMGGSRNSNVIKILQGEDGMNGLRLPPASPFDNFLKAARYDA